MIGKLKGKLAEVEGMIGLIETAGGVFYRVFLTPDILGSAKPGVDIEVYTYLNVKEDSLTLFGFADANKYRLFELFLGVSGVGPKSAFAIVSFAEGETIINALSANDIAFFSTIPGIGKKTASRIILEVSGKLDMGATSGTMALNSEDKMAVDALVSLGFDRHKSTEVVTGVGTALALEEKISTAIRSMTKK